MSNGVVQNSLDNLAHIANMSHELQVLNQQLKEESGGSPPGGSTHGGQTSTSSTPPPTLKSGKLKRMACVECRQQKSRCDAHEKHPDPCTRCQKKGLQCDLKSDYKRTYKRARIAQIEREFSELKKTLTSAQTQELFAKVPSLSQSDFGSSSGTQPVSGQSAIRQNNSLTSQVQSPLNFQNTFAPATQQSPLPYQNHTPSNSIQPHQQLINQHSHLHHSNSPYDNRFSHNSSETNNSIPNTPSIYRPLDESIMHTTGEIRHSIPHYSLDCEEKTMDSVSLSPETIKSLYLEYVERYHQILPVVDISLGPERIYKLCPSLFWVIMFVSLRRFNEDSEKSLLLQLSPLVKGILAEIMISPISRYNPIEEDEPIYNALSVYSVQAFLLYSYWPPITSSLSADSSYNTIGNAIFQAVRIGLHSPGSQYKHQDQPQEPNPTQSQPQISIIQENSKTWILCNIVSQTIATSFGFPAFTQFDTSIWTTSTSSAFKLPVAIKFMMEISNFEDQVSRTLNTNPMDPYGLINSAERLPILKLFMRRLNELEIKMNHELPSEDGFRKFQLYAARVHLLSYFFMDSSRVSSFELQKGLIQLFNAAITLINHTQSFQIKDKKFVKYLPGVYILDIWQAACILGKLIHSPMKKFVDTGSGKQSYEIAISLAAKASIMKHDIAHRSSGIMRNMWQLFRTLHEKNLNNLNITIRNRMSASVFFDCLFLLRDQVGMTKFSSHDDEKNEVDGDEIDDEYGDDLDNEGDNAGDDNEEALVSDDEKPGAGHQSNHSGSQKSTPGSTTSSLKRRQRSLSNTVNAESKARKIIRTIPLDPQPISINGKRSSIFKVVNNSTESSPQVRPDRDSPNSSGMNLGLNNGSGFKNPQANKKAHNGRYYNAGSSFYQQVDNYGLNPVMGSKLTHAHPMEEGQPATGIPGQDESPIPLSLDSFDMNSDLLWKDVDSVMNDFGFHTQ
ncbi:uncharacterized protein CANTADRAFT_6315 [Suhomyces tanzawaensis NRRL Y-17324]|uniref:Zn(2)-C6 fungal-type domain-containing protein n=1 Tax=Suhomyces tanzawaensis NRRL Y-17324 TaxID=984487 RepID=A0A1E4SI16_9ASCO|nr:uncharacterized protein CANTADRAFT_6315 [Suhomyces tanzawaensis NRRL Y-17324]ODV79141.1 hypothetical protein CANTADRAFT_6315 [Suhomyces tanzawaensis NRRL Y-17324]